MSFVGSVQVTYCIYIWFAYGNDETSCRSVLVERGSAPRFQSLFGLGLVPLVSGATARKHLEFAHAGNRYIYPKRGQVS